MTDVLVPEVSDDVVAVPSICIQLGNETPASGGGPEVATLTIPQGDDRNGNPLHSFPDEHNDEIFAGHPHTAHIAEALAGTPDAAKRAVRRALIDGQYAHASGVRGLPDHAAASVLLHPNGAWAKVAGPGQTPGWVSCPGHPGYERFVADYFGCPVGIPADVEDRYLTRYGSGVYPAGSAPDPLGSVQMGHTTYGVANQALVMGGFGYLGTVGTATAATATTLAGSAETGVSHASNDCAGQYLVVGPNASGTGSKVFGLIVSNTTGTTPTYTVDQWYNAAAPGGAVGTTPNATAFYQVMNGGPSAVFVALSSDATAFSFGGSAGTADAATIATALTSELVVASSGLLRKIAPITVSGHTWIATPVFTATAADQSAGAQTVAKAAFSPSIVSKALLYMTLVSPTAVISATGDQLTLTWTITETNT